MKVNISFNCVSFFVWKSHIYMSCFLEDIDPILPKVHFMFFDIFHIQDLPPNFQFVFFDRYWSHIQESQEFPSHVFRNILIPDSIPNVDFMVFYRYRSHIQNFQNRLDGSSGLFAPCHFHLFENVRFPKSWDFQTYYFSKFRDFSGINWVMLCFPN